MQSISRHITLLVINSIGRTHTHTQTHTHTDDPHWINFKKPGVRRTGRRMPGLEILLLECPIRVFTYNTRIWLFDSIYAFQCIHVLLE